MEDLQSSALPTWLRCRGRGEYRESHLQSRESAPRLLRGRLQAAWHDQPPRKPPQNLEQLAFFVALVGVLALLVGGGGLAVDDLDLDHAEGDAAIAGLDRALGQPDRQIGDEVEHPEGIAGELVALHFLLPVVILEVQTDLQLRRESAKLRMIVHK